MSEVKSIMKDENIKQLIYDIQREKDSQKQVELVKTFETTLKTQILSDCSTKIEPTKPVSQINKLEYDYKKHEFTSVSAITSYKIDQQNGLDGHKFVVGTKIKFPTFEKLRLEGWIDDGEYIVHPNYDTVFLSHFQVTSFEDTMVTITRQNNPGEYSIKEDSSPSLYPGEPQGCYDDWPFDLMNITSSTPSEKLNFDDQSLQEQVFHILDYLENEPNQMIIPDGRVRLLKETLGDYKPYDEVCYLPTIKTSEGISQSRDFSDFADKLLNKGK